MQIQGKQERYFSALSMTNCMASGTEGWSGAGLNQYFLMAEEASRELLKIPILRHYPASIESDIVV